MKALVSRKWWRVALVCGLLGGVLLGTSVLAVNQWITRSTAQAIFRDPALLPPTDVGLVLGTRRYLQSGRENLHFRQRVNAAANLHQAGKVRHLLLSGDNSLVTYDEPSDMRAALLDLGVPDSAMTLDHAGFRTLDSVVRAREVFGLTNLVLITDDFHTARAVFIAERSGLDAIAFSAEPVPVSTSARSRVREVAARVKAVLDLYVLCSQPHFLGDPEPIEIASVPERSVAP